MKDIKPALTVHFAELDDPRVIGKTSHLLINIVVIAICSVIAGATGWEQIEIFAKARQDWFSGFLELPNGIPGHDTFRRVLSKVYAEQFQNCFLKWVQSITQVMPGEVIPIDGKTLRRFLQSNQNIDFQPTEQVEGGSAWWHHIYGSIHYGFSGSQSQKTFAGKEKKRKLLPRNPL